MKKNINFDYLLGQRDALAGILGDLQQSASWKTDEEWEGAKWMFATIKARSEAADSTIYMARRTIRDEGKR